MIGNLYLIPTTLGETEPLEVMPLSVKKVIEQIDYFIVENEKSARRFIKKIAPKKQQPKLILKLLDKYAIETETQTYLDVCKEGIHVGLLSEAGVPAIADPGANIVKLAHQKNIKVVPLVGPSSILMAMMSSGMNGQNFAFNGYLPIDKAARKKAIKLFEKKSIEQNQTQVFIETPYRNNALLNELSRALRPKTLLNVACDITLTTEWIKTAPAQSWRDIKIDLHKRPTVFSILGS